MTYDRQDFQNFLNEKTREKHARHTDYYQQIVRAAVAADKVTGDPNLDTYLSYLQGLIETTQANVDGLKAQLNGEVFDHTQILLLKHRIAKGEAWIYAWNLAMDIPRQLNDSAVSAKKILQSLENLTPPDNAT
jgi:hypothetical protein